MPNIPKNGNIVIMHNMHYMNMHKWQPTSLDIVVASQSCCWMPRGFYFPGEFLSQGFITCEI